MIPLIIFGTSALGTMWVIRRRERRREVFRFEWPYFLHRELKFVEPRPAIRAPGGFKLKGVATSAALFGLGILVGHRFRRRCSEKVAELMENIAGCSSLTGQELLNCPMCWELFVMPVVLSCGHSSCLACVVQLRANSNSWACPICRKEIEVPMRDLVINYSLKSCVEAYLQDDADARAEYSQREADAVKLFDDALAVEEESAKTSILRNRMYGFTVNILAAARVLAQVVNTVDELRFYAMELLVCRHRLRLGMCLLFCFLSPSLLPDGRPPSLDL